MSKEQATGKHAIDDKKQARLARRLYMLEKRNKYTSDMSNRQMPFMDNVNQTKQIQQKEARLFRVARLRQKRKMNKVVIKGMFNFIH